MAPLHTAMALAAPADVSVKLPVNGLARDLDLELLGDMGFVEGAAAVGADVGRGRLVNFSICSGLVGCRWALGP
jgi:hypothetical protein